eukprot:2518722-Pyramimonas_sp.AAC.1
MAPKWARTPQDGLQDGASLCKMDPDPSRWPQDGPGTPPSGLTTLSETFEKPRSVNCPRTVFSNTLAFSPFRLRCVSGATAPRSPQNPPDGSRRALEDCSWSAQGHSKSPPKAPE